MSDIKVSDITPQDVAEYLRLDNDYNPTEIQTFIDISKNFIKEYTGQGDLDKFPDLVIVVYILCQDMYDNRTLYVDKTNLNKVVETILGMHSINLL